MKHKKTMDRKDGRAFGENTIITGDNPSDHADPCKLQNSPDSCKIKNLSVSTIKRKRILYGISVLLWMGVIFIYSSQNAEKSTDSSTSVTRIVLGILNYTGIISTTNFTSADFLKMEGLIRTLAHFAEYLIFGLFNFQFFRYALAKKSFQKVLFPLLFCLFYALTDEIHQYFVPGRAMQLEDWLVDAIGAFCGILLMLWIMKGKTENKKQLSVKKIEIETGKWIHK